MLVLYDTYKERDKGEMPKAPLLPPRMHTLSLCTLYTCCSGGQAIHPGFNGRIRDSRRDGPAADRERRRRRGGKEVAENFQTSVSGTGFDKGTVVYRAE